MLWGGGGRGLLQQAGPVQLAWPHRPPPRPSAATVCAAWARASTALQGNVILADDKFEVLTLLRSHRQASGRSTARAHDGAWAGHAAGQMAAQVTAQLAGGRVQPGTP